MYAIRRRKTSGISRCVLIVCGNYDGLDRSHVPREMRSFPLLMQAHEVMDVVYVVCALLYRLVGKESGAALASSDQQEFQTDPVRVFLWFPFRRVWAQPRCQEGRKGRKKGEGIPIEAASILPPSRLVLIPSDNKPYPTLIPRSLKVNSFDQLPPPPPPPKR